MTLEGEAEQVVEKTVADLREHARGYVRRHGIVELAGLLTELRTVERSDVYVSLAIWELLESDTLVLPPGRPLRIQERS